jgi:hypothetical protein
MRRSWSGLFRLALANLTPPPLPGFPGYSSASTSLDRSHPACRLPLAACMHCLACRLSSVACMHRAPLPSKPAPKRHRLPMLMHCETRRWSFSNLTPVFRPCYRTYPLRTSFPAVSFNALISLTNPFRTSHPAPSFNDYSTARAVRHPFSTMCEIKWWNIGKGSFWCVLFMCRPDAAKGTSQQGRLAGPHGISVRGSEGRAAWLAWPTWAGEAAWACNVAGSSAQSSVARCDPTRKVAQWHSVAQSGGRWPNGAGQLGYKRNFRGEFSLYWTE